MKKKQEKVFSLSPLTAAGGVCALPSPLGIYSGIPLVFISQYKLRLFLTFVCVALSRRRVHTESLSETAQRVEGRARESAERHENTRCG